MPYTLMKLPYAYDALEPHLDARTMEIHYSKHHQTYVDKLNAALEKYPDVQKHAVEALLSDWNLIPKEILTPVRNFGGGVVNHNFYWSVLKKDVPAKGAVIDAITKQWGSLDAFKTAFSTAANTLFGSGWAWLVYDPKAKKLDILQTSNQDSPLSAGKVPLLVVDVWEHAYYLKFQQKRADFVAAFWSVVNWEKVDALYQQATKR
jgi:Fe-Mn family superoxide dismutase